MRLVFRWSCSLLLWFYCFLVFSQFTPVHCSETDFLLLLLLAVGIRERIEISANTRGREGWAGSAARAAARGTAPNYSNIRWFFIDCSCNPIYTEQCCGSGDVTLSVFLCLMPHSWYKPILMLSIMNICLLLDQIMYKNWLSENSRCCGVTLKRQL